MGNFFDKIPPKWLTMLAALFIVGRAITAVIDKNFGVIILSSGGQISLKGVTLYYIANTILLPIVFAVMTVELSKNKLSAWIFNSVLMIHILSVLIVSARLAFEAINVGAKPVQGYGEGVTILNNTVFFRSVFASTLTTFTTAIAVYWRKKDFRIFQDDRTAT